MIERGDWQVSEIARAAYDLEGKVVGTIGAGRIGYRVLQRLVPFNCKELLYYDYAALPEEAAKAVNARRIEDLKEFVSKCDVVTVNCPLHEGTRGLVNEELLKHFKKGAWLVNTARGAICDKDAVAAALKSGQLFGYSGDVWNVQPAPKDHPWRTMKNPLGGGNGMVPHYSGTTLDAQARYAAGTKSILENYLENKPQEPQNIIVGKSESLSLDSSDLIADDHALQRVTRRRRTASAEWILLGRCISIAVNPLLYKYLASIAVHPPCIFSSSGSAGFGQETFRDAVLYARGIPLE